MCLVREPDAGDLHVRFDERDVETELRRGYSGTARRKGRQQTNRTYCHRATSRLYPEVTRSETFMADTFSFADYYDPGHTGYGALAVINEDRVQPGTGFGMASSHPDMEIISYVSGGGGGNRYRAVTGCRYWIFACLRHTPTGTPTERGADLRRAGGEGALNQNHVDPAVRLLDASVGEMLNANSQAAGYTKSERRRASRIR